MNGPKEKMKYRCSHCDYATVEGAALKKHVRFKHTNERPYMCSTCGFSTHTHSAMARHKRGHEQSKPYACKTCGKENFKLPTYSGVQIRWQRVFWAGNQGIHQNFDKSLLTYKC